MLLSMAANVERVGAASSLVIKNFTFFLSYLLVIYFVVSIVRSRRDLDRMLALLVGGGGIIALAALIEWRTGTNFFGWYSHVVPFLNYIDEGIAQTRDPASERAPCAASDRPERRPRAPAPDCRLSLPTPPQQALARLRRAPHAWRAVHRLSDRDDHADRVRLGFLCIKPRESVRLIPWVLPMLVIVQVIMPGTLGTMKSLLNPSYVIKEQSYDQGATAGRIADLGPALDRWATKPLLGSGFGTTVADPNAPKESEQQILDNQWLGTLLQIGALGALSLLWLFGLAIARLARRAWAALGGTLAQCGAGDVGDLLRPWHAHLRRVRIHPGDLLRVRDHRLRSRRAPLASAGQGPASARRGAAAGLELVGAGVGRAVAGLAVTVERGCILGAAGVDRWGAREQVESPRP